MKNQNREKSYYPVCLDLAGRKCVVVGGGEVARRKVKALLEHRASVEVISPELCPGLAALAQNRMIKVVPRFYRNGDLSGAFLAIAATDDADTNQRVSDEAHTGRVMVNVVDDAEKSDFIAPSYLRRGGLTIAVSTSGQSPALARKIRTRLEALFQEQYGDLARLVQEVRAEIKHDGIRITEERWQDALEPVALLEMLANGERQKARAVLVNRLKGKVESSEVIN